MPLTPRITGQGGRLFADPTPTPDETTFQVDNTSDEYYESPYYKQHQDDLQAFPKPRTDPPRVDLADVLPAEILDPIANGTSITFHAVGDTGAARHTDPASVALANEAGVADRMTADLTRTHPPGPQAPAFFFHLGDVVYEFGEDRYYYDQFYEPFREYDRPIFAIPGNHDGVVFGESADKPAVPTLTAFLRNFCATTPGNGADAGALVRSTMDQPGVYFTLDAPHVSIIGLYSNVLEGPGAISTQGGKYPTINDDQLDFLTGELTRLKPAAEQGERAVVLAVHHPPVSADAKHSGTTGLAADIDACATKAGFWPDAVLSGHAHLYQRFTRATSDGRQIPYIVAGAGGYNATQPQSEVKVGTTEGDYTLAAGPIVHFGYLTATVDTAAHTLQFTYHPTQTGVKGDSVTIDLATHTVR
jgi:Calcineurin-like phosphoesterase